MNENIKSKAVIFTFASKEQKIFPFCKLITFSNKAEIKNNM